MKKVQRMGGAVVLAAAAVLLAAVAAAAPLVPVTDKDLESDASMWKLYERWCSVYSGSGSSPDPAEKARKFEVFKANARHINEFNEREDEPYKLGLNHFSDMTQEEFNSGMYTGALNEDDAAGSVVSSGMADDDKLLD